MTDTAGDKLPFPGFPGFPPAEMLDKMWDMMRLTPFGAAFPGMQPGTAQGFGSPLTAMSDMMSPLTNVEELDKRITDMRAVEQWLKLNLSMLQSAIQALEVQRATLSTLRAFGAFAQASMTQPAKSEGQAPRASAWGSPAGTASSGSGASTSGGFGASNDSKSATSAGNATGDGAGAEAPASGAAPNGAENAAFDPSGWWNLLQSQFNQLAAFAMTQPGADAAGEAGSKSASSKKTGGAAARGGKTATSSTKPAAKRAPARKAGAKPSGGTGGGASRDEK